MYENKTLQKYQHNKISLSLSLDIPVFFSFYNRYYNVGGRPILEHMGVERGASGWAVKVGSVNIRFPLPILVFAEYSVTLKKCT